MRKYLFLIFVITSVSVFSQSGIQFPKDDTTAVKKEYPYVLPIWGQKVTDRNIDLQLPFGLNVNYVYNQMSLELTHFSMNFYNGDNLDDILNPESLNFKETIGTAQGVNVRADAWVLPFFNFYGMYSRNRGSTQVSFQPQSINYDTSASGVVVKEIRTLKDPIEVDPVYFTSNTFGAGATAVYGWNNYFINFDGNVTWSTSDLLEETVVFFVGSGRVGRRVTFKNGMKLAFYFGAMYRNFVGREMNTGSLGVPELDAGMIKAVDALLNITQERIDFWEKMPDSETKDEKLNELNQRKDKLNSAKDRIKNENAINYSIKKEIINNWSTQVGFNFEINKNWTYRAELGYREGQKFFMTGLQYRFGL